MAQLDCLATRINDPAGDWFPSGKSTCYEQIDADTLAEGVRKFGEILAENYRAEAEMLEGFEGDALEIFHLAPVTQEEMSAFVEELVARTGAYPDFNPTIPAVYGYATLGSRVGILIHVLARENPEILPGYRP